MKKYENFVSGSHVNEMHIAQPSAHRVTDTDWLVKNTLVLLVIYEDSQLSG